MKIRIVIILSIIFLFKINFIFSQEWKNLKSYQKSTGYKRLVSGCWLKKDRKKRTEVWAKANVYNLKIKNGYKKYKTLSERRDFYIYINKEIRKKGHQIKWVGIAVEASIQFSKLDIWLIRIFVVRSKEVTIFANDGSKKVFAFSFPKLKTVFFSREKIIGKDAENWDKMHGMAEQCEILEPLYKKLSKKALKKLYKMIKGRGIYRFGVPTDIKYKGDINDCISRYNYGIKILFPYSKKNTYK